MPTVEHIGYPLNYIFIIYKFYSLLFKITKITKIFFKNYLKVAFQIYCLNVKIVQKKIDTIPVNTVKNVVAIRNTKNIKQIIA